MKNQYCNQTNERTVNQAHSVYYVFGSGSGIYWQSPHHHRCNLSVLYTYHGIHGNSNGKAKTNIGKREAEVTLLFALTPTYTLLTRLILYNCSHKNIQPDSGVLHTIPQSFVIHLIKLSLLLYIITILDICFYRLFLPNVDSAAANRKFQFL